MTEHSVDRSDATAPGQVDALIELSGKWTACVWEKKPIRDLILNLDSSVSETYGDQEDTTYNGHIQTWKTFIKNHLEEMA